jgi:UDP-N-acetylmuramoyl-tripeptide--D-alanyl-D-alanine ligase
MLELGPRSAELHAGLNAAVKANAIDTVFCCGPMMCHLWAALSTGKRGGYAENSAALESQVVGAIRAGDVIMVKGSLGSRMKTIVSALEKRYPGSAALSDAAV